MSIDESCHTTSAPATYLSPYHASRTPPYYPTAAQCQDGTVRPAAHAAEAGSAAVAVIAPPYFLLDDEALAAHLEAAAAACAPTPFYLYEFERVSGYAVPLAVVERLRERASNLAG